jgi:hypothetical protein
LSKADFIFTKELAMISVRSALPALVLLAISGNAPVSADVLLVESVDNAPPNTLEGIRRPTRGMNMARVEKTFGEPRTTVPAVGDPPITRWDYDDYTVYFEHNLVLHSVIHHSSAK